MSLTKKWRPGREIGLIRGEGEGREVVGSRKVCWYPGAGRQPHGQVGAENVRRGSTMRINVEPMGSGPRAWAGPYSTVVLCPSALPHICDGQRRQRRHRGKAGDRGEGYERVGGEVNRPQKPAEPPRS